MAGNKNLNSAAKAKKDELESVKKFSNSQNSLMSDYFENEKAKSQTSQIPTQSYEKKRQWLWAAIIGVAVVLGGLIYQVYQMNQQNTALQNRLAYEREAYERQLRQQSSSSSSQSSQSSSNEQSWWSWLWDKIIFWD